MATAQFFAPGFDEQVEQQNIERQRKMAELLRQQSTEMPHGSMVSGHYVAPSFTQGLAKMLQAYSARAYDDQASDQQKALAEAIRGRTQEELGTFTKLLGGEAARDIQPLTPNDDEGNAMPVVHKDAVPGDLNAAYQYAAKAQTPALQQFGVQGALTHAQEQAKLAQAEALRQRYNQILSTEGMTPQKALAMGVPAESVKAYYEAPTYGKVKGVVNNGQLQNPFDGTNIGTSVPKQPEPANPAKDLLIPDPANPGKFIPNTPLVGVRKEIAASGASKNSNTTIVADKTADTEYIKQVAKSREDNKGAVQSIQNAQNIRRLVEEGKVVLGPGTDAALALSRYLPLPGKDTAEKIANTRVMMQQMGQEVLANAHFLKPMSNSDIDVVNRIIGADPNLDAATIKRGMELYEEAKRAQIASHNRDAQQLKDRNIGQFDYSIPMPAPYNYKPIGVANQLPSAAAIDAELAARRKRQGGGAR